LETEHDLDHCEYWGIFPKQSYGGDEVQGKERRYRLKIRHRLKVLTTSLSPFSAAPHVMTNHDSIPGQIFSGNDGGGIKQGNKDRMGKD